MVGAVIFPTHRTLLENRNIMEEVLVLHETLNSVHHGKPYVMLFKVDFEKVCDKIKWRVVYQMLQLKMFPTKWYDSMMNIMRGKK